jgi:hypothetical protein
VTKTNSKPPRVGWRGLAITALGLVLPFQGGCLCGCATASRSGRGGPWSPAVTAGAAEWNSELPATSTAAPAAAIPLHT